MPMRVSGARIDGAYRYRLWREWGDPLDRAVFIMLNPSSADAEDDDPTIRRCLGFAMAIGCGALDVVNLFAYRTPDPDVLLDAWSHNADIVGPENDAHIGATVATPVCYPPGEPVGRRVVICAWGAHPLVKHRAAEVLGLLRLARVQPLCLRQTKDGHPGHPLFLPAALRPVPLVPRAL